MPNFGKCQGLKTIRKQITLYVPKPESVRLEAIRQRFNPVQFELISAHVTLCRDEDDPDWPAVQARAEEIKRLEIKLRFGAAVREDNLVYLPVIGKTDEFDSLRTHLLDNVNCRKQVPHITLIHPRNARCSAEDYDEISSLIDEPLDITFRQLTFIEQRDGFAWQDLKTFPEHVSN